MPTPTDWAQLATFIDSEGCFLIATMNHKISPTYSPVHGARLGITNTSTELMNWLVSTFGGRRRSSPASKLSKMPGYLWDGSKHSVLKPILENCMPFFIIKKRQAMCLLAFLETYRRPKGRFYKLPSALINKREFYKRRLQELKRIEIIADPHIVLEDNVTDFTNICTDEDYARYWRELALQSTA